MPYDPTFPTADTRATASAMRAQLNALNDKIDAVPAVPMANVIVDAANLLPEGSLPTVDATFDGTDVHLVFGLPAGPTGEPGPEGGQGPALGAVVVDSVITLPPGSDATVDVTYVGNEAHFTIGLPRGEDGAPGDVTTAQLDAAIAGTSANTNTIPTLDDPFGDDDLNTLRLAYNALVLNGRR